MHAECVNPSAAIFDFRFFKYDEVLYDREKAVLSNDYSEQSRALKQVPKQYVWQMPNAVMLLRSKIVQDSFDAYASKS